MPIKEAANRPRSQETVAETPYPGLRPFQADDSKYFFGRDLQVREVVARLRDTRFVAVVGGSGSGKSSLVLAGAIPRLRAFAIEEAGDLWIPVISTPGTDHADRDGPLHRLARKFCALLDAASVEGGALDDCVELLQQQDGLGKIVGRYGRRVKDLSGIDLKSPDVQVNFLFLIDQFEEIFHPSNGRTAASAGCESLVNRVVEQFKRPHPQVCVALTMRSEHLNDCPRYQDLPDAINAAAYLVKRLDGTQLKEAIEQPALRYLRKLKSAERLAGVNLADGHAQAAHRLPSRISFDEDLMEKLMSDSRRVLDQQDHADHLPLLQHLLFWIWAEGCNRCQGQPVPERLTMQDLHAAIHAQGAPKSETYSTKPVTALEACLENRCEAVFKSHPDRQSGWEQVFRSLAFKEPNTGTYTQQRAGMDTLSGHLGLPADGDDHLLQYLQPWMGPHAYFHWDVDSRSVKVAHETLIRRWQRFRRWVDDDDRLFQTYVRLLEECSRWKQRGGTERDLLSGGLLRRFADAGLSKALTDDRRIQQFARLSALDREGRALAGASASARSFLEDSQRVHDRRERERQDAQAKQKRSQAKSRRNKVLLWAVLPTLLVLIFYARVESQFSKKEGFLHLSYAFAAETKSAFGWRSSDIGFSQLPLRNALLGARLFHKAGQDAIFGEWPVLKQLWRSRLESLQDTELLSEARNVVSLSTVLLGSAWVVDRTEELNPPKTLSDDFKCDFVERGPESGLKLASPEAFKPAYFFPHPIHKSASGLVVTQSQSGSFTVYAGSLSADTPRRCTASRFLGATPPAHGARLGVSQDLTNILFSVEGQVVFYAPRWSGENAAELPIRFVLNSEEGRKRILPLELSSESHPIVTLHSSRTEFGMDVHTAKLVLRLFDFQPARLGEGQAVAGADFKLASNNDACRRIVPDAANPVEGGVSELWQLKHPSRTGSFYCVHVVASASGTDQRYVGALYTGSIEDPRGRQLPLLSEVAFGTKLPIGLRLDPKSGWLSFQQPKPDGWYTAPGMLEAWEALARPVFKPHGIDDVAGADGTTHKLIYGLLMNEQVDENE